MDIFFHNKQLIIIVATLITSITTLFLNSLLDLDNYINFIYFIIIIPIFFIFYNLILFLNEFILINFYSDILENRGHELISTIFKGNFSDTRSTTNDLVERTALKCIISYLNLDK
jgi:hypothetical protein